MIFPACVAIKCRSVCELIFKRIFLQGIYGVCVCVFVVTSLFHCPMNIANMVFRTTNENKLCVGAQNTRHTNVCNLFFRNLSMQKERSSFISQDMNMEKKIRTQIFVYFLHCKVDSIFYNRTYYLLLHLRNGCNIVFFQYQIEIGKMPA